MRRILVLRALGLGDLLTAVPALRAIRRRFPRDHVTLATPAPLAGLVALIDAVDDVVDAAPLASLPTRPAPTDLAINLHGRGPQSSQLLAAIHPRRLLAFRHPEVPSTLDGPLWRAGEHEVVRWCRLLEHFAIPADPTDLVLPHPAIELPQELKDVTVIHPGASSRARQWPPERWGAVARSERDRGRTVVVTGSAAEVHVAQLVVAHAGLGDDAVLAGRTDVLTLAAVVASAGRVVCGDTGVAHLASAFRTPSVVLFGPVPPSQWGPPPGPHRVIWKGAVGDTHADEVHAGLMAVTAEEVVDAVSELPPR